MPKFFPGTGFFLARPRALEATRQGFIQARAASFCSHEYAKSQRITRLGKKGSGRGHARGPEDRVLMSGPNSGGHWGGRLGEEGGFVAGGTGITPMIAIIR